MERLITFCVFLFHFGLVVSFPYPESYNLAYQQPLQQYQYSNYAQPQTAVIEQPRQHYTNVGSYQTYGNGIPFSNVQYPAASAIQQRPNYGSYMYSNIQQPIVSQVPTQQQIQEQIEQQQAYNDHLAKQIRIQTPQPQQTVPTNSVPVQQLYQQRNNYNNIQPVSQNGPLYYPLAQNQLPRNNQPAQWTGNSETNEYVPSESVTTAQATKEQNQSSQPAQEHLNPFQQIYHHYMKNKPNSQNPSEQQPQQNVHWTNLWKKYSDGAPPPRHENKRYLVIHPDGTTEYVNKLDAVAKKHPNYFLVNAGTLPHNANLQAIAQAGVPVQQNPVNTNKSSVPLNISPVFPSNQNPNLTPGNNYSPSPAILPQKSSPIVTSPAADFPTNSRPQSLPTTLNHATTSITLTPFPDSGPIALNDSPTNSTLQPTPTAATTPQQPLQKAQPIPTVPPRQNPLAIASMPQLAPTPTVTPAPGKPAATPAPTTSAPAASTTATPAPASPATPVPTTPAPATPTTSVPATPAPPTSVPATPALATPTPTTPGPTTPAPTTPAPTTPAPTTPAPTTPAPTTPAPTTPAPTTPAPTTPAPAIAVPTTKSPTTSVPSKPTKLSTAPTKTTGSTHQPPTNSTPKTPKPPTQATTPANTKVSATTSPSTPAPTTPKPTATASATASTNSNPSTVTTTKPPKKNAPSSSPTTPNKTQKPKDSPGAPTTKSPANDNSITTPKESQPAVGGPLDLSTINTKEPITWFKSNDSDILSKLIGDEPYTVVYFIQVRPPPIIEKDVKTTVYSDGRRVEEVIETVKESADAKPKVKKTVTVFPAGGQKQLKNA